MPKSPEEKHTDGLTQEQIERIRDAVLASVYEDIGRSVVKKILWVAGAVLLALFGWLYGTGHIK